MLFISDNRDNFDGIAYVSKMEPKTDRPGAKRAASDAAEDWSSQIAKVCRR